MEQKRKILPPVYLLLSLLVMAALHRWWPILHFLAPPNSYVGAIWVVMGVAISGTAARSFNKAGTPVIPFERSTTLVTSGLFCYTRNPMYLGMVLILVGAWLLFGTLSSGLPIIAFVWVISVNFIAGEERFLTDIFGQDYLDYTQRVRRWV